MAVKGRDRCGIDDDAAFQRFAFRFVHLHDRRALAEHRESPNQIHLNNKIEFGNVESAFASNRTRGRADARAVYIDVNRTKVLGDLVNGVADGFVIRDIDLISAGVAGSLAVAFAKSSFKSKMATLPPLAIIISAVARPKPEAPPVATATFPSMLQAFLLLVKTRLVYPSA